MKNIQVRHTLPHRIRLKVPAVRNNTHVARRLEKSAADTDGIFWVRANTTCGGLVVRFDAARFSEADIIALFTQYITQGNA